MVLLQGIRGGRVSYERGKPVSFIETSMKARQRHASPEGIQLQAQGPSRTGNESYHST